MDGVLCWCCGLVQERKEAHERYAIASDIKIVFAESMADDAAAGTIGCCYTGPRIIEISTESVSVLVGPGVLVCGTVLIEKVSATAPIRSSLFRCL